MQVGGDHSDYSTLICTVTDLEVEVSDSLGSAGLTV